MFFLMVVFLLDVFRTVLYGCCHTSWPAACLSPRLHIQTNKETRWRKFSVTEVLLPGQRDHQRGLPKQCESPVPISQIHLTGTAPDLPQAPQHYLE